MKKIFKSLLLATAAFAAAACQQSDIDDLERDIENLRSRLTALETQVDVLNDNVEALQKLLNGATVNSVEEKDGVYTITLSNGEVLTLTQGSEGGYYTPTIGVDNEGYWVVSFDNATYTRITDADGKPVCAVASPGATGDKGQDGVTPQFKVDAAGNWLVSYDAGKNYVQVLGADGKPVNASNGTATDRFFADVKVDGSLLTVTLLDGKTYEIPIFSNFKCAISGASEGVVTFALNEVRSFDVTMAGVAATVVTAPEGWNATLAAKTGAAEGEPNHTLTVSAPKAATRAVADSRTDVCILAVADNGLSTIAKLRVVAGDVVLHSPTVKSVTVDTSKSTETTLTFSVETDDANGWKYIVRPSADAAPEAAEVFENGTAGTAGAVTAEGLTQGTAYTIYVAAHYDSTVGATLGTAEARTVKAAVDYWEQGATLAGTTYDKNTSGAQLITATTEISKPGVYFLDPADGAQITLAKCTVTEIVLIGRNSTSRPKVTVTAGPISLGSGKGFIVKNVELDAGGYNNYLFNFASGSGTCENLIFEDSKLITPADKQISYFNNAAFTIGNVEVTNSLIHAKATGNGKAMRFINLNNGFIGKSMTVRNSVFYTDGFTTHGTLLHANAAAQAMPEVVVSIRNCSFVNYIGQPNGYFNLSTVKKIEFTKNILWSRTYTKESFVFKFLVKDPGAELDYKDNLAYGLDEVNNNCWQYFQTGSLYIPEAGCYEKAGSDPFLSVDCSTDTFIPADSSYGAVL